MSTLEIIALNGIVYKVKSTGSNTEPCGPYASVSLSHSVFLIFTDWCLYIFQIRRKMDLSLPRYSIPI